MNCAVVKLPPSDFSFIFFALAEAFPNEMLLFESLVFTHQREGFDLLLLSINSPTIALRKYQTDL